MPAHEELDRLSNDPHQKTLSLSQSETQQPAARPRWGILDELRSFVRCTAVVGRFRASWQLLLRTQHTTSGGEYLDTRLYRLPGSRVVLVQMRCRPHVKPRVEMIELRREDVYLFGLSLGTMTP